MARISREEALKNVRPNRVPAFEGNRNKLAVKGLDHENFYYRWVNDTDDRLQVMSEGGYEYVMKSGEPVGDGGVENTSGTGSAYTKGVGGGITAYLMRLPMTLWLEDQKVKEEELNAKLERDMKKSMEANFNGNVEMASAKRSNPTGAGRV